MRNDFDLVIVGSGFGGSLLALIARRLGLSTLLLEQGRHPRFAIGESSTPLANLLLEEIAGRYDLPQVGALTKWGTWQRTHPRIACGLKRGFTFFHHEAGRPWRGAPDHADQLLVAASPHDQIADTHWFRPDFDHLLVREAMHLGAELWDEVRLQAAVFEEDGAQLHGERHGQPVTVRARLVIDATGPRGFLHRTLDIPEASFGRFPETQALYTHFKNVRRWEALHPSVETPPYPVDDAALHHVFAGGWIWVLRFNNGLTSAGVAAEPSLARRLALEQGATGWARLLDEFPSIRDQFQDAVPVSDFRHSPRLAFRTSQVTGPRWVLLPSAAGFVDPLLSTGFALTLLGIQRLAEILPLDPASQEFEERMAGYATQTLAELDIVAELVDALYAHLDDFEVFTHLTYLYFAAAMFSETLCRLRPPEVRRSFLRHDDSTFGPALRRCLHQARLAATPAERGGLLRAIREAIEPLNLAELGAPDRRRWYPCLASDLLKAAPKLGVQPSEVRGLLTRAGFGAGS